HYPILMPRKIAFASLGIVAAFVCAWAFQTAPPAAPADRVADPFDTGWMVVDTNGDGIADFIAGKIVVPAHPSAAENAAAANLAARAGFASTGMTPPVVIAGDSGSGPRIWVGKDSAPASSDLAALTAGLEKEEGGVFFTSGNLAVIGA